jgi:hypothetical protein
MKATLWEDVRDLRDNIAEDWAEEDPAKEPLPAVVLAALVVSKLNEILAAHTKSRAPYLPKRFKGAP